MPTGASDTTAQKSIRESTNLAAWGCWWLTICPIVPPVLETTHEVWANLRGHEQFILWIASIYWPCYLVGPSTMYQQQIQQLAVLERDINPHNATLLDLQTKIQEWQTSGDHVILLTDYNNDVMVWHDYGPLAWV